MIESFKLPVITPETVSGSIVSFDDEYGGLPLKSCVSQISGYQEGSGTPSPDNVRPLHAFSSADLYFNTINQWDEQWELGDYNSTTGLPIPSNNTIRTKNPIRCMPNTTYYKYIGDGKANCIYYYDANGDFISRDVNGNSGSRTITTPANCHYMKFSTYNTYGTTYLNNMSINYPATDTSYHAFSGAVFTFGQSIYQGSIDWKRGVVVGTWGYFTDNGIIPWTKEGDYNNYYTYNVVSNAKIQSLVYCNIQRSDEPPRYTGNSNAWISSSGRFNITLPEITSREAFLTLISNTPIQVAYELATPIEIPLGGIQLLTQEGQNNIFCDTGDTTLEWLKVN